MNILFFNKSFVIKHVRLDAQEKEELLCLKGHNVYSFTSYEIFKRKASDLPAITHVVSTVDIDDEIEGEHIHKLLADPVLKEKFKDLPFTIFSGLFYFPDKLQARKKTACVLIFPETVAQTLFSYQLKNGRIQFDPGVLHSIDPPNPKAPSNPHRIIETGKLYREGDVVPLPPK